MKTPQKAQSPVAAGQSAEHKNQVDILAAADAQSKHIATLRARLALAGFVVIDPFEGSGFIVGRWDRTKFCKTAEDLEVFCRRVGVQP